MPVSEWFEPLTAYTPHVGVCSFLCLFGASEDLQRGVGGLCLARWRRLTANPVNVPPTVSE